MTFIITGMGKNERKGSSPSSWRQSYQPWVAQDS